MKYDLIIFDIDGVVADTVDDFTWIDELYKQHFPEPEKAGFDSWDTYLPAYGNAFRKLDSENGEEVLEGLNVNGQDVIDTYRALQVKKERIMDGFSPYKDAEELLSELESKGVKIAAVSNSSDSNTKKFLTENGLISHFDFVQGLDLESFEQFRHQKKPNSRMLEEVIEKFEASKERTLMIGDSSTDEGAAGNAGVDFIKVNRGENNADADYEPSIDSLDELRDHIQ